MQEIKQEVPFQQPPADWLTRSGLRSLFRAARIACGAPQLGIAFCAIVLTVLWGSGWDAVWKLAGEGVSENAIDRFRTRMESGQAGDESPGSSGVFEVWKEHQAQCVNGCLKSWLTLQGLQTGDYLFASLIGTAWLVFAHPWFAMGFGLGALVIWSLGGGAICRLAAVKFARDDQLTVMQAIRFARDRFVGGFLLAPLVPVGFLVFLALFLLLGGLVLRIPLLGDLLGGPLFILAILLGGVAAVLLIGMALGGSLLWPVVAAEATDAFDAFQRSLSYALQKWWKVIAYGAVAAFLGALCWLLAFVGVQTALAFTRIVVSWGSSWFGAWPMQIDDESMSKLALLWPADGAGPTWRQLSWWEYLSAGGIQLWTAATYVLPWAFLVSFFFSANTIIYFLLRKDVDQIDLTDVFVEESSSTVAPGVAPSNPTASNADV
jgi:hypothetical protein